MVFMRSHAQIVKAAGAPEKLAETLGISIHTVRSWIQRDSLPPEHWVFFASGDEKVLIELAKRAAENPRKIAA